MDKKYNSIIERLDKFREKFPNITNLWDDFLQKKQAKFCKNLDLNIIGTMCIPPNDDNTKKYFSEMNVINQELNLKELSMGMSNDYLSAIEYNSSYVRVGSKIFGSRV